MKSWVIKEEDVCSVCLRRSHNVPSPEWSLFWFWKRTWTEWNIVWMYSHHQVYFILAVWMHYSQWKRQKAWGKLRSCEFNLSVFILPNRRIKGDKRIVVITIICEMKKANVQNTPTCMFSQWAQELFRLLLDIIKSMLHKMPISWSVEFELEKVRNSIIWRFTTYVESYNGVIVNDTD